ncbi:hypothetical protein Dimus_036866 [Dionaea muscipula]
MSSSPVIALPRFIMLKANNYDKFLRVVAGEGAAAEAKGHVQFTADTGVDPGAKFAVEASTEAGNRGLVHIRSCFTNRYLARESQDSSWIKAWSPVKDEVDKTHWACTLFEPIRAEQDDDASGRSFIRLRHVQQGSFVSLTRTASPAELDWGVSTVNNSLQDVFRVTDWESVLILPRTIALKGSNGKYLTPRLVSPHIYPDMLFNGNDIADATLPMEVIPIDDGSRVHIMNRSNGMPWRYFALRFTYVILQASPMGHEIFNVFSPTRLTGNLIALHSVGSGLLCRLDHSDLMLKCDISNITTDARLQVVEPVMRRTISVNFRFEDTMIYDVEPITLTSHTSENSLVDTPHIARVALSRSYTDTRSWDNSLSLTVGVETTFRTGIPVIAQAGIQVTTEINDTFTFGKSHEVSNEASAEVEVTVPPMSKVKVSLMALKGSGLDVATKINRSSIFERRQSFPREPPCKKHDTSN